MSLLPPESPVSPKPYEMAPNASNERGRTVVYFDSGFLRAEIFHFKDMIDSNFAFMLAHLQAEMLAFTSCTWDGADMPHPAKIAARSVCLVDNRIDEGGFHTILTSFPKLRELEFYRVVKDFGYFDDIGRVLSEHGQRLEYLLMMNENHVPFNTEIGSLHTLTNLKTLKITLEFLIGFRDNPRGWDDYGEVCTDCVEEHSSDADMEAGSYPVCFYRQEEPDYEEIHSSFGDWSLAKLLPPSLEELELYIEQPKLRVYFYTYERYGAKFEELLTDVRFDKLRTVSAPLLEPVAEKLRNGPTRWVLDSCSNLRRMPVTAEEA
ncbi:hypothetical protein F4802DRAFT_315338 [Xylaria palmicola]|nr:hypothetical protein F4802DRAFT_315338 [Xylaria palmicola]